MLSSHGCIVGYCVGTVVGTAEGAADGDMDGNAVGAGVWPTVTQPCSSAHFRHSFTSDKKSVQQFFLPSAIFEKSDDKNDGSVACTHTLHLLWSLLQVSAPEPAVGWAVGAAVGRADPPAAAHPFFVTQEAHCP